MPEHEPRWRLQAGQGAPHSICSYRGPPPFRKNDTENYIERRTSDKKNTNQVIPMLFLTIFATIVCALFFCPSVPSAAHDRLRPMASDRPSAFARPDRGSRDCAGLLPSITTALETFLRSNPDGGAKRGADVTRSIDFREHVRSPHALDKRARSSRIR